MDRGYTNFLTHLHIENSSVSLPTIQATLSHYLANASPLPTPLAGTVVSSPLFLALSYPKLQTLSAAFRYAFHAKYKLIEDELKERRSQPLGLGLLTNLVSQSLSTRLKQWSGATLKGLQGGHPILRLACCSGMLLGMEDLRVATMKDDDAAVSFEGSRAKGDIEDDIVVALAESMDRYSYLQNDAGWEREFRKMVDPIEADAISLSLVIMAQCAPLIPLDKLRAIPLQTLARLLASSLEAALLSGSFLTELASSLSMTDDGKVDISEGRVESISLLLSSPLFLNIGPLSRFSARTVAALFTVRPSEGLLAADMTLSVLMNITGRVDAAWLQCPFSGIKEDVMTPRLQALSKDVWNILKPLLFTVVMIAKECLQQAVYVPPLSITADNSPTPTDLSISSLRTLSNLSFVVYEFGGVSSLTSADPEGGFKELKETFYSALDILTARPSSSSLPNDGFNQVELWAREACTNINTHLPRIDLDAAVGLEKYSMLALSAVRRAKTAFVLASIEQLVVSLNDDALNDWVLPICLPILDAEEHREVYESAHSVVLAVFSSRSQASPLGSAGRLPMESPTSTHTPTIDADIALRLVPSYITCLIELLIAMAEVDDERYWPNRVVGYDEHAHQLHLMLISSIPCLPPNLLPRVLDEIRSILIRNARTSSDTGSSTPKRMERYNELVKALLAEIVEGVGDREKDFVMRWWHDNRLQMIVTSDPRPGEQNYPRESSQPDEQKHADVVSRL
ncbi:hypothetical protein ONZ45_g17536 [Pleurotus djamor]|nr:hypothetical protein ONZ45_g17536 [Pleurotus djamor]